MKHILFALLAVLLPGIAQALPTTKSYWFNCDEFTKPKTFHLLLGTENGKTTAMLSGVYSGVDVCYLPLEVAEALVNREYTNAIGEWTYPRNDELGGRCITEVLPSRNPLYVRIRITDHNNALAEGMECQLAPRAR